MTDQCSPGHHSRTTSAGIDLSESSYLDAHFEAMHPEYETMICSIGIEQDWRVLDAGCGGGIFPRYLPNWRVKADISVWDSI